MELGHHAILDGWGVDPRLLNDPDRLEAVLRTAVLESGATVLSSHHHRFSPQGVTVVLILAESHASIHTYPEHGAYMADVFTCGDIRPDESIKILARALGGDHETTLLARGTRTKSLDDT